MLKYPQVRYGAFTIFLPRQALHFKILVLACIMALPAYAFAAPDRSAEIAKIFENKDGVDITVDGKYGLKNAGYSYYVSSGVLYEVSSSTYAVALKDIDPPRATTGKETVETLSGTGKPAYYLIIRLLDGRKVYLVGEHGPPVPARDVMILFFKSKAMADQALVYLKRIVKEAKTGSAGGEASKEEKASGTK